MEYGKSFHLSGFYLPFSLLIFFKNIFLENYDRYETQTLRVDYLEYELLISIRTDNLWVYHGKMVSLVFNMVRW